MSEYETAVADDVLRLARPGVRWLSTGWRGGFRRADAAYNVTVPDGFDRTDLDAYLDGRLAGADLPPIHAASRGRLPADSGIVGPGDRPPALLTGVAQRHARGACSAPVVAVATAGLSNPAALPMDPTGRPDPRVRDAGTDRGPVGTVNVLAGTTRALDDGALAGLLGTVVEARAATLLAETGFPGTTTDAAVVGADLDGNSATFAGSGTEVGAAARACVRAAVRASLRSRYAEASPPATVEEADHGLSTDRRARTFEVD